MGDYAALVALAVAVACAVMASAATPARAQQCGQHAGGMLWLGPLRPGRRLLRRWVPERGLLPEAACPGNLCCDARGVCGLGVEYCGAGGETPPATSRAVKVLNSGLW
ncbi:chitinase 7-like [Panicum virgatum]|uniref:chitinase 7-like n=1 Tax=Panicum virgatum TaxID=38727 RepID=UPI0019D670A8|nr:chitinase 7-like [Panicum virgatum]